MREATGLAIPRAVLANLYRAAGLRIDSGVVSSPAAIDPEAILGDIELTMVQVLREHGPLMTRHQIRDECLARGMNRHSLMMYLSYSAILERVALRIYALRGSEYEPGEVAALAHEQRRATPEGPWMDEGWCRLAIGYRVNVSIFDSRFTGIPAGVRKRSG